MAGLRSLGVAFLVSASAFSLALAGATHPQLAEGTRDLVRLADRSLWQPALAYAWRADAALLDAPEAPPRARVVLTLVPPVPDDHHATVYLAPPPVAPVQLTDRQAQPAFAIDAPQMIVPDLPAPPAALHAPAPRTASSGPLTPDQARARDRLAAGLTPTMRAHFGLFLFVSKASSGPLAQRMYVFREQKDGALALLYDWPASTGREKPEVSPRGERTITSTPAGYYQFDPDRMYGRYRSYNWDQDMPHAMFFNWQHEGQQSGLAIHAATGDDITRLGQRASAGCVHLAPDNARTLFDLVRSDYRGAVPRFAIDGNDTMHRDGKFAHDAGGNLRMADGYRVLIDIENYGGGENADAVAALF